MHIIDRRLNPGGKSLANRQRFLRRAKALVRKAVRECFEERDIKDIDQRRRDLDPAPRRARAAAAPLRRGRHPRACRCPATRNSSKATRSRGPMAAAAAAAPRAAPTATARTSSASRCRADEFLDLFLEDLELPELAKRQILDTESPAWRTAPATRSAARPPTCRSPAPCATACRAASRCGARSRDELRGARGGDRPGSSAKAATSERARRAARGA